MPPNFAPLLLLLVAVNLCAHGSGIVRTALHREIHTHALRKFLPSMHEDAMRDAIFELDSRGHLVSHSRRLDIDALAPTVDRSSRKPLFATT